MARQHAIGRAGETWIESATGGQVRRVRYRPRYAKMADFAPWRDPRTGLTYQIESKSGAAAEPKKVRAGIEQARGYSPGAIPVVVFRNVGSSDPIAALPFRDLLRLLGLAPEQDAQLLLGRSGS